MNRLLALLLSIIPLSVWAQTQLTLKSFDKWSNDDLKPGVAIAVIHNEEITLKKVIGYGNLEYRIPLNNESVFDIASLAKQFTGFAVAKLVIEEKLDLNDSVNQYLPELKILNQGIRIKHLVYHTSGLRDVGELFGLTNLGDNLTSKEAIQIIENQKELNFPVGSEYDYSNSNYVLLALIVEKITGESFREWCSKYIFQPLQMQSTFVNDNPYEIIKNRAVAYYSDGSTFSFNQKNGMALIGSSAVYSTIDDMLIWLKALQSETKFSQEFALMKKKGELDDGEEIGYGFGLSISTVNNELMIEHSGATPSGFRTQIAIFPNSSLAFVILSNWGDIEPIDDFGRSIINHYLPASTIERKTQDSHTNKGTTLSPEILARYVGDYLFNGEMNVKIRQDDKAGLTVQLENQQENSLIALTETEFDLPALQSRLIFIANEDKGYDRADVMMGESKEGELVRVKAKEKEKIDLSKYTGKFYSQELGLLLELEVDNNQLEFKNTKYGDILLAVKSEGTFIPQKELASSIIFLLDEFSEPYGFLLNRGSRMRNLKFLKIIE